MKIQSTRVRRKSSGMALMAVVVATFSVVSILAVLLTLASFSNDTADVERRSAEARYLGLGALEAAENDILTAVANWEEVPDSGSCMVGEERVDYAVEPTGLDAVLTDGAGIQTLVTGYEIRSIGESWGSREVVHKVVNVEATPIFQFAVFYDGDLEVFPGPSMSLNGRMHTNSDLFIGCNNTLTCNTNYVHAVGNIYRYRKDDPTKSPGTVNIRRWVDNPFDPGVAADYFTMYSQSQMDGMGVDTETGYDSQYVAGLDTNEDGDYYDNGDWFPWGPGALYYWSSPETDGLPLPDGLPFPGSGSHAPDLPAYEGYTVLDQAHGVSEAVVPSIGSIAMFQPESGGDYAWNAGSQSYIAVDPGTGTHTRGFFHEQADLSIIVYANGTWDAFDAAGSSVKYQLGGVVTQKNLYDARQAGTSGRTTKVLAIDVQALNASAAFPDNGLLYASHYGLGTGVNAKGIELLNGSELAAPFTVVSEGSVYVQGDYNTNRKKPAAVIGDAVNLLSNAWNDSKRPGTLPIATNTTYNMAIVTGNHETAVGQYNGGFENLPRFHEDWASLLGRRCTINGSFVNMWASQFATAHWSYGGDRYTAPARIWSYDTMFNNIAFLPPFTPMAVTARDVVSW